MNHIAITNALATSYTKALVHNPKDTVFANMERAVLDNPEIVRAVNSHADLVEALRVAQSAIATFMAEPVGKGGLTEGENKLHDAGRIIDKALAKAKGE